MAGRLQFRGRAATRGRGLTAAAVAAAAGLLGLAGAVAPLGVPPASSAGLSARAVPHQATSPSAPVIPAPQVTFTVDTTADTHDADPGTATCADANGNCSLRAALEAANALLSDATSETVAINVPAGTYTLTLGPLDSSDPAGTIVTGAGAASTDVTAAGASQVLQTANGPGGAGALLSLSNLTLEDGSSATSGGALEVADANDMVELNGVTVSASTAGDEGGGAANAGELFANDSTFSSDTAAVSGGGVSSTGPALVLTGCTVTGDSATSEGGGVFGAGAVTEVSGGTVSDNTVAVPSGGVGQGGGIWAQDPSLTDATVTDNTVAPTTATATDTEALGGGIFLSTASSTDGAPNPVSGLSVTGNTATATGTDLPEGGGAYDEEGTAITDSTFSKNAATGGYGGGIGNEGTGETLTDDTLSANTALFGGGLYNDASSTDTGTLFESNLANTIGGAVFNTSTWTADADTVSGDAANRGAGLFNSGTASVLNSTFTGNLAVGPNNAGGAVVQAGTTVSISFTTINSNLSDQGGAIYVKSGTGTVGGSIVSGNISSGGTELDCATLSGVSPLTSTGYNVFGDTSCNYNPALDKFNLQPQLSPLGSYGGPTPTMLPLRGSPALGNGGTTCPSTDQRGVTRPEGAVCDSGSVELQQSYWEVASDGGIFTYGPAAKFYGSTGSLVLNKPIVGMAATPDNQGYWLVASDGGVFSFGDAQFYGSTGLLNLVKPIVGMASTPDGKGYWLVASDGGVFTFGDAGFYGSTGGLMLNQPIVGMAPTPDGGGYWLVASDGGIFSFGDANFYGSTGAMRLNKPVVGMTVTPDGRGYWLVATDGGIFAFGDARFYGSTGNIVLNKPMVGMTAT